MYSRKCVVLGLWVRKTTNVLRTQHISLAFNPLNWTKVCSYRAHFLQKNTMTLQNSGRSASQTTVDPSEVKRFQSLASKWWDEQGEFAALHAMNDLRVPFIRDNLLNVNRGLHPGKPLAGLKILDIGCGGGLLTEPLGRLGAAVLGVDPVADSIATARLHLSYEPDLQDRVQYSVCTLEDLMEEDGVGRVQFDAVVASEVVEHLADLETFVFCCNHLLKPGGSVFITTINKTRLSYALAIVAAERLLGIVPIGTHNWDKFISPEGLECLLESNGLLVQTIRGMLYNPMSGSWGWVASTDINYALHALKPREELQQAKDNSSDEH